MSQGRIVERGTHEELEALHGLYHKMLAGQTLTSRKESAALHASHEALSADKGKATPDASATKRKASEEKPANPDEMKGLMGWVWQQTKPYKGRMLLAVMGSILAGCIWPIASFVLSEAMTAIIQGSSKLNNWCLAFVGLMFCNLAAHWVRGSLQFFAGEGT